MKFINKIPEKKMSKFMEFVTVIDTSGPYNQDPT